MIVRCTIADLEIVDAIFRHPDIYPFITTEGSPKDLTALDTLVNPYYYYLMGMENGKATGIFSYHPRTKSCYISHASILPKYRGKIGSKHGNESIEWMFGNTDCKKIVAVIPSYNFRAYVLAKKSGMCEEGRIRKCIMKNGKWYDEYILGIREEDFNASSHTSGNRSRRVDTRLKT